MIRKLSSTKVIIFDKTGTLTEGSLEVQKLVLRDPWANREAEIWKLIALLEGDSSEHPVGKAIWQAGVKEMGLASIQNLAINKTRNVRNTTGLGISGDVELTLGSWYHVTVGSFQFLRTSGIINCPDTVDLPPTAELTVSVAVNHVYAGALFMKVILNWLSCQVHNSN